MSPCRGCLSIHLPFKGYSRYYIHTPKSHITVSLPEEYSSNSYPGVPLIETTLPPRVSLYLTNSIRRTSKGQMPHSWPPRICPGAHVHFLAPLGTTPAASLNQTLSLTRLGRAPLRSPLNTAVISFYRASGRRCPSATSLKESNLSGKTKPTTQPALLPDRSLIEQRAAEFGVRRRAPPKAVLGHLDFFSPSFKLS